MKLQQICEVKLYVSSKSHQQGRLHTILVHSAEKPVCEEPGIPGPVEHPRMEILARP
jgi:hypothetical protein